MPHNVCICVICAINTYIWACGPFVPSYGETDIEWSGLALFSAERCSTYRTSWQHCRLKLKNCGHRYSMATPANKAGSCSNKMMMTCKQAAPPFATCAQDSFCIHFWSILAAVPGVTSDHNFVRWALQDIGPSWKKNWTSELLRDNELGFYMQNTPVIQMIFKRPGGQKPSRVATVDVARLHPSGMRKRQVHRELPERETTADTLVPHREI